MKDKPRNADRVKLGFHEVGEQITTGLQALLELRDVSPSVRAEVREYMGDVLKGLVGLQAEILAPLHMDPISGFDPKEHGHATLAGLFAEIRHDEAARREENDQGIER